MVAIGLKVTEECATEDSYHRHMSVNRSECIYGRVRAKEDGSGEAGTAFLIEDKIAQDEELGEFDAASQL